MPRHPRTFLVIGLLTVVLGSASVAQAQYGAPPPYRPPPGYGGYPPPPPAPPPQMYRQGLTLGVALGGGGITADNCPACGGGFAYEFHIGGMLTPQVALMLDLSAITRTYNDGVTGTTTLSNSLFTVAAQYWVIEKLWLKGGIGGAHIGNDFGDGEDALGLLFAGGVEVFQVNNFALDLQLRIGHGTYDGGGATNIAFLVGANWY